MQGRYNRDHAFFHEYHVATRTQADMQAWLDEWVYGLPDRAAYLAKLGAQRWEALAPQRSLPAAMVDYGY